MRILRIVLYWIVAMDVCECVFISFVIHSYSFTHVYTLSWSNSNQMSEGSLVFMNSQPIMRIIILFKSFCFVIIIIIIGLAFLFFLAWRLQGSSMIFKLFV